MERPNLDALYGAAVDREERTTHWEGCEADHPRCALIKVINLVRHLELQLARQDLELQAAALLLAVARKSSTEDASHAARREFETIAEFAEETS